MKQRQDNMIEVWTHRNRWIYFKKVLTQFVL